MLQQLIIVIDQQSWPDESVLPEVFREKID